MGTVVVTGVAGSLGRRVAARLAGHDGVTRLIGIDMAPRDEVRRTLAGLAGLAGPAGLEKVEVHSLDLAAGAQAEAPDDTTSGQAVLRRLRDLMAGADAVIHLAWQTADAPHPSHRSDATAAGDLSPAAAAEANRVALHRVLAAAGPTVRTAAAGPTVRTVVHLSSATVYGAWPDNRVPLTEDTVLRPNPEFAFAAGKADAERIVADWASAHTEVAVSVLRPAVTVGSPERPLYLALAGTRVPGGDDGGRPVQFLHVDDLAAAVVVAWSGQLRGVYNVAPDGGIPEGVARALVGVSPSGSSRGGSPTPGRVGMGAVAAGVPREARAYTVHPWVVAPDRLRAVGWVPQYSSEEALVATDDRPHFEDLPPGRRQNVTLLLAAGSLAGAAAAGAGAVLALRARTSAGRPGRSSQTRHFPPAGG